MGFPLMLYAQLVRGLSPTESALLLVPMAADVDRAGAVRRQAHRPGPPAGAHRRRASRSRCGDRCWLSPGHDARLARPGRSCCRWPCSASACRHLGAARRHRHPQPADAAGGRRCRRLQRDPPGRRRARLRRDRGAHGQPAGRPGAGRRRRRRGHDRAAARAGRTSRSARRCRSRCCCPPAMLLLGLVSVLFFVLAAAPAPRRAAGRPSRPPTARLAPARVRARCNAVLLTLNLVSSRGSTKRQEQRVTAWRGSAVQPRRERGQPRIWRRVRREVLGQDRAEARRL